MKKLAKFIFRILKDEKGLAPWVIPAAISTGSTILGATLGKNRQRSAEPFPGYFGLGQDITNLIKSRLGQSGARYAGNFEIPQPEIESQTEDILSDKLGNLPKAEDYKTKIEASKTQQIEREKERAVNQLEEEKNMYNRLGLVSSTPWLTRAGKLGDESLMRQKDIEKGMDIFGLDYNLQADRLAEDIANQYLTQGQVLGRAQRGYEQYPIQMTFEDWLRAYEEPYRWANLGAGMIGDRSPDVSSEPNIASQLGMAGQDIGSLMLMSQLLKK